MTLALFELVPTPFLFIRHQKLGTRLHHQMRNLSAHGVIVAIGNPKKA